MGHRVYLASQGHPASPACFLVYHIVSPCLLILLIAANTEKYFYNISIIFPFSEKYGYTFRETVLCVICLNFR